MDISLYYREKGQGEPFILLHGNGGDGSYFKNQIEYFSDCYKMIAVDTRGHGKSPRGTKEFTIAQFATDLNDLMTELEIPKAIILGFSDGANIAMKFAVKYPDKVKALILNGGNLNTKGVKPTSQIPIEIGYRIAKRFAEKSEKAKQNTKLLNLMVNEPNISPDELSKISAPTLVIAGTKDMIKTSHTREIAKNIPNARLSIIKGNHFIASKKPEKFNKEVEKFLQTVKTDKCAVFYEGWQMECCGEDFSVGSNIKWIVCDGAQIKLPVNAERIDYCYEAHSSDYKNLFILEGKVKEIKAFYEKYEPSTDNPKLLVGTDGALYDINSSTDIACKKNNMCFSGYIASIENYSIRPAQKEEIIFK